MLTRGAIGESQGIVSRPEDLQSATQALNSVSFLYGGGARHQRLSGLDTV